MLTRFIPDDTESSEDEIYGVSESMMIVKADTPDEAYAEATGWAEAGESETMITKSGQTGKTVFDGFRDIIPIYDCLLYTSPSPRDATLSRMPSSA